MINKSLLVILLGALLPLAVAQVGPEQGPPPPPGVYAGPDGPHGPGDRRGERFHGTFGTITAIQADSLTLKGREGETITVKLSDKTEYMKEETQVKLSDFRVGDRVIIAGDPMADRVITARRVMLPPSREAMMARMKEAMGKTVIAGEVKAMDGAKLTVARPDDQTQVIQLDENTSLRKDGQSITLGDIKVGDHVFGRGALKGGTFVPTQLNVGEMPRMRMPPPPA
ncbi:MAG: DUF5666 domain-containing protein [Terriglobales bacterium]